MFGAYNEDIGAASQTLVLTEVKLCLWCRLEKIVITSFKSHRGGGTAGNSWWGCATQFFKLNPDPISDRKKCHFSHLFSDLAFKKLLYHYLDWNSKKIGIYIFLCLSYIIWNWDDKYNMYVIHSCSSLKNHSRFQTKMDKVYTHFQTKTVQKPYPLGRHIPIRLI